MECAKHRAVKKVQTYDALVATVEETGAAKPMRPGDFKWIAIGQTASVFKNNGDKEARLVLFQLKPQGPVETTTAPTK